eukprot:CAMPEP_0167750020 /NCGR_PEP_ID=MMETSP0110_2-20121227/5750_1 /TAXON_ID=629695 /ORGANISM="Gymnochlora sp., Strain CCMP2014" /LENGTH=244 /DNA_ID=CAMNT_0007635277 /DNA_START=274 /DNA_END=1008 /DNA_ORIENTATION=+
MNWEEIRRYFTGEVAEVASSALENRKLLDKSNELALAVAHYLIYDKKTQEALTTLVLEILQDDQTKEELVDLFSKLFQDPEILDEATKLSTVVTHRVLEDDTVNEHAMKVTANLFNNVLGEEKLQNKAGVALWNSIKYAIVPNWFGDYATGKSGLDEDKSNSKWDADAETQETMDPRSIETKEAPSGKIEELIETTEGTPQTDERKSSELETELILSAQAEREVLEDRKRSQVKGSRRSETEEG